MASMYIKPKEVFTGALPDSVEPDCNCCGKGEVEIKCPFCHCNDSIPESSHFA